ncbi:hypothetical protein GUITHDRAFT_119569 [Guillardia theta CCMP2712]|uniref:Uncharacterized protein n=1 Tax=Guillardia theta (strain CCMP2712) TaxID=905079 RepID=L1IDP0_GUITC|nr:hypothetical protein GUITHDRAFT_119569 [Guillardia theta CCMP2712]EKX34222.1 hypothetical protein GUITHDRAFT_119569 [Guillardia theta CCMP2712]|eukprot:XP_005821202.1 hypothetical protein GUITHDRAFT_119569 [Guillardia theta CCMP2712]
MRSRSSLMGLSSVLLLLLLSHNALAADYGQLCYSAEECRSEEAPYCQYFFTDNTYKDNTQSRGWSKPADETRPRKFGLCVQCISDCDCGVNEYCGIDNKNPVVIPYNLTSNNTGTGLTPGRKLTMMVYAKQFEGLPLRSKCKSYDLPKSNCDTSLDKSAYVMRVNTTVPVTSASDTSKVLYIDNRVPSGWPKEAEDRYCGRVNSWAPAFYRAVVMGNKPEAFLASNAVYLNSTAMSTGGLYNTPATCVPHVAYRNLTAYPSCQYVKDSLTHTDSFCCKDTSAFATHSRACGSFETSYRDCVEACQPLYMMGGSTYNAASCTGTSSDATVQKFCSCLNTCKACVKNANGCSSDTVQGECKPCTLPPSNPGTNDVQTASSPITDGYFCPTTAVQTQTNDATKPLWSSTVPDTYCRPTCVDCLVNAARNCRNNGTCMDMVMELEVKPQCSTTGEFKVTMDYFSFHFISPPIDYTGHCTQTDCKICLDGQERCTATDNKGPRQICISNEWVSWTSKEIKQPAVDVGSRALIAIAVFTAFTFVAGLLVAITIMHQKPAAPQQLYLPAPQQEKYGGEPAAFVQTPGDYQQPGYVPTVTTGQLGQYA